MRETIVIKGRTAADMFQMKKSRYNAFAYGHGVVLTEKDKLRSRNSKQNQRERYLERVRYTHT